MAVDDLERILNAVKSDEDIAKWVAVAKDVELPELRALKTRFKALEEAQKRLDQVERRLAALETAPAPKGPRPNAVPDLAAAHPRHR